MPFPTIKLEREREMETAVGMRRGMETMDSGQWEKWKRLHFFSHKHPITLIETEEEGQDQEHHHSCYNCGLPISSEIFGCSQCKIFLHESCADEGLRLKIRHAFHRHHPLEFQSFYHNPFSTFYCTACGQDLGGGFFFNCGGCGFQLCLDCAFRNPNISQTAIHDHLLTFFSKLYGNLWCHSCGDLCDASVLRCVECNFNLHIRCFSSLPATIKHECHIDPLILITDPDLVDSDKGHDEFYCDACEELRDPKHPVYYCSECPFVAHLDCVISEILSSLVGQGESDVSASEGAESSCSSVEEFIKITGEKKMAEKLEIPLMENCLGIITGDQITARQFFSTLTEEAKYAVAGLGNLDEKIDKIRLRITRRREVLEEAYRKLEAVNARLKEAEDEREELLDQLRQT